MQIGSEDEDQYRIAERAVAALGAIPGSFSLTIYLLIQNAAGKPVAKDDAVGFQLRRMLSVPKLFDACEAAARAYNIEWEDPNELPPLDPLAMTGLLFSVYLHHRMLKICDQTEWDQILPQFFRDILVTGIIMRSVYKSGLGIALIGTTAFYGGLGAICAIDKKTFKDYRMKRKLGRFFLNPDLESGMFGCSAVHIGKELIQRFRFGTKVVESFVYGFDKSYSESVIPPSARPFRTLCKVLDAIHSQVGLEKGFDGAALGVNAETSQSIKSILDSEQKISWIMGKSTKIRKE